MNYTEKHLDYSKIMKAILELGCLLFSKSVSLAAVSCMLPYRLSLS